MSLRREHGPADPAAASRAGSSWSSSRRRIPGTTDELVRGHPRRVGAELRRGLLPRVLSRAGGPGQLAATRTATIPKVVGGVDRESRRPGAGALRPGRSTRRCGCPRRGPPRRRSSSRTSSARSTSRSSTSSRSSSTGWASTSGRCSTPPPPSPSASCASTRARAGAVTASRSTPSTSSWKAREYGVAAEVHRAGRRGQRPDAALRRREAAARPERAGQGGQGQPRPRPRARLQEGHRRPAREPGLRDHRWASAVAGPIVGYHDPHVPAGAADARRGRICRR